MRKQRATPDVSRHRLRTAWLGLALAGCSPLVATIGYEQPNDAALDSEDAPELDGSLDAPDAGHEAGSASDAALNDGAIDAQIQCWHLPDVVGPATEAGVLQVVEGEVIGAADRGRGCNDAGTAAGAEPVTYSRTNDSIPLLLAGREYGLAFGAGSMGTALVQFGERCAPGPIPATALIALQAADCFNIRAAQDSKTLHIGLGVPSPWPAGFTLCDAPCSATR